MHCFFCETITGSGHPVKINDEDHKHLFKTLRAKPGDRVELIDGKGTFATAVVNSDRSLLVLESAQVKAPSRRVHLFTSPPRKQKMDTLLKQCAEVGIWSIIPFYTTRTVSKPEKQSVLDHWKTLLKEGCKQAKNPFLPEVMMPVPFEFAVQKAVELGFICLFGSPKAQMSAHTEIPETGDVAWIVGPEGGFTEEEEDFMIKSGFKPFRIGRWVMRVETAAICGTAILNTK